MKYIVILLCLISLFVNGQSKFEKEYRLKEKEVPKAAINFIEKIDYKSKLKWYREESSDGESVEAKFKINKIAYSIEFDTLGVVEDIEELIRISSLDSNLQTSILNQLDQVFEKHQIIKIQKQLKGENKELIAYFKEENKALISGYELIVKAKRRKEVNLYEYFFTAEGVLSKELKVLIKSAVHLEY
jgi:hypothetical protein